MTKTKLAIFNSAIDVFSKNGYEGATMDEIACNAGVAKGTLYYYFKSKEEIFQYVIKEGINVLDMKISKALSSISVSIDRIIVLCKVQLELVYEHRNLFKVILSQLWGQELRQIEVRGLVRKYIMDIEKYLKEAIDDGTVKSSETSFMSYTFFGTVVAAAVYELINEDKINLEEIEKNLTSYILKGIQNT